MKLLENTRSAQPSMQLIESSNTSEASNFVRPAQPKLTMTWVQELHEGRQSMVAKWIVFSDVVNFISFSVFLNQ